MRIQTTTWEELDLTLDRFLDDELDEEDVESVKIYSVPHRVDAWNWSQRILALHTPRQREATVTAKTGERSAVLPPDFLAVWRIHDSDREKWLRQMGSPQTGSVRFTDDELPQYWVWGGELYLERTVEIGSDDLKLYYWAYWPEIEYKFSEDDYIILANKVLVPPWSILALCHLTAATLLQPGALQAARIRTWNITVDSGRPIDNSRAQQAREHLWWWHTLIKDVPPRPWREGSLSG